MSEEIPLASEQDNLTKRAGQISYVRSASILLRRFFYACTLPPLPQQPIKPLAPSLSAAKIKLINNPKPCLNLDLNEYMRVSLMYGVHYSPANLNLAG